jgi:ribosomal-protein-alanine N-acetyltransferase
MAPDTGPDIVPVGPEAASDLAALHAASFQEPWTADGIERLLRAPASLAFAAVAPEDRSLIGFVLAFVAADEAEIVTIAVTPNWRRRGLARRLLATLEEAAAEAGALTLHLDVDAENMPAIALYLAFGFELRGRRPGYYRHAGNRPPTDSLLLGKPLAPLRA